MGVGKYSPTVSRWYMLDQKWHEKYCRDGEWVDIDGYDRYGYHHETGLDRAGYDEMEYAVGEWQDDEYVYQLYGIVYGDWRDKPIPVKDMG